MFCRLQFVRSRQVNDGCWQGAPSSLLLLPCCCRPAPPASWLLLTAHRLCSLLLLLLLWGLNRCWQLAQLLLNLLHYLLQLLLRC
jgi:hypothetical protein